MAKPHHVMRENRSSMVRRRGTAVAPRKKTAPEDSLLSESTLKRIAARATPLVIGRSRIDSETYIAARDLILSVAVTGEGTQIPFEDEVLFPLACELGASFLPGYATLDSGHIKQIGAIITSIQHYIDDSSVKRPLNILMLASPGAGKSFFIKCLAGKLRGHQVEPITFNMTGLQHYEDLISPLDAARNLKVQDKIPLLFLDEFDTRPENSAILLPLLWDGELNLGQRDLKLGKAVIVLAGSNPSLPDTINYALSMQQDQPAREGGNQKLIDLLSRINGGVLQIPTFYDPSREIDRRPDKVCITIERLRQRFGPQLQSVTHSLLRFIAQIEFRYGPRSIAHLIDTIPYRKGMSELTHEDLHLPLGDSDKLKQSSIAYHLIHKDGAHGVAQVWHKASHLKAVLNVSSGLSDDYVAAGIFSESYIPQFTLLLIRRLAELVAKRRRSK